MDSVQVLITTMEMDNPDALLEKMNVETSFVIGNQDTHNENKAYTWNEKEGLIISRSDRGVGNNRNETLKYATADFCILADDDMTFYHDYSRKVVNAFQSNPKADVLIFNIDDEYSKRRKNKKKKCINYLNYMNYGAARIVFRRNAVSYNAINFNRNFGGGTLHSAGEDSLFLHDCLLHGLKIVAIPETIAKLNSERESTWFKGYNTKYLFDKGVFLGVAHPCLSYIFAMYLAIKHKEYREESKNTLGIFKDMCAGIEFVRRGFNKI